MHRAHPGIARSTNRATMKGPANILFQRAVRSLINTPLQRGLSLINTPLQRGAPAHIASGNRFNGFPPVAHLTHLSLFLFFAVLPVPASENVPHRPFAQWADVPARGQFVLGLVYEESEAYHIWAGGQYHNVTTQAGGENYGIDINQGYLALQYGLTEKWAADLNVGYTTAGWRYFNSTNGQVQSTSGFMDISFGIRYQLFNETNVPAPWVPTLTFRAGPDVGG